MASSQSGSVSSLEGPIAATGVGPTPWTTRVLAPATVQISVVGTGPVAAVVDVEVSNGPSKSPIPLDTPSATITLSGPAGYSSDGFSLTAPWRYVRFNVRSLSGIGAVVTGLIGA